MVLYGERGAKERHDAVARRLVHRSFKAVDGIHHLHQDRVHKRVRFLRILARDERHRSLCIGKEKSDQLALALERGTAREDARGEMRWYLGFRGE